jgi:hypothetical protein
MIGDGLKQCNIPIQYLPERIFGNPRNWRAHNTGKCNLEIIEVLSDDGHDPSAPTYSVDTRCSKTGDGVGKVGER